MSFYFPSTSGPIELATARTSVLPISFFCWFCPSSAQVFAALMSINRKTGTTQSWAMMFDPVGGVVNARTRNNVSTADAVTFIGIGSNIPVWAACGAVFESDSSRYAYINGLGVHDATTLALGGTPDTTDIGSTYQAGSLASSVHGDIAHAAIWQATLNPSEMMYLAQGGSPLDVQRGQLLSYLPLNGIKDIVNPINSWQIITSATHIIFPSNNRPPKMRSFSDAISDNKSHGNGNGRNRGQGPNIDKTPVFPPNPNAPSGSGIISGRLPLLGVG